MAKKCKVEKETRKIMEAITDLVKRKGDKYKFKNKNKKDRKKIMKGCVHWVIRKGKECPSVSHDPDNGDNWKCLICGETFPVRPKARDEYVATFDNAAQLINQLLFYSVKLGGDADDTRRFIQMRRGLKQCAKSAKHIVKALNKRDEMENNRKNTDQGAQFSMYSGYNYKG